MKRQSAFPRLRLLMLMLLLILFCYAVMPAQTTISGIINSYRAVTLITTTDCCSQVTLSEPGSFTAGDRVLIIQMKGATITSTNTSTFGEISTYNSAGNYEFATVKAVSGNVVDLDNKLSRSYNPAYAVQLVRVPSYTSPVTVVGQLTAQPWNGTTGGILVFEAPGQTVTLNANMDVSTLGFRGGAVSGGGITSCNNNYTAYFYDVSTATNGVSGFKGEGIGSNNGLSLTSFELGRGAIANGGGGGNNHNSGGGGGSNSNSGGNGGATYRDPGGAYGCSTYNLGGVGGYSLDYVSSQRAFLAGGGGGGHEGDGPGYAHSATPGGNGGGLIIVKAGSIAGNGNSIISNGGSVSTIARRDGGGGGGAGGSILLDVQNYVGSLSITANGGVGGSVNSAEAQGDHGPGGGGSGGVVWISSALPGTVSTNVAGGASGTNTRGGSPHNATAGSAGITMENLVLAEAGPCCAYIEIEGIINTYAPVGSITTSDCCSQVTLSEPGSFTAGDRVLIIQMKGATITSTNTSTFGEISTYNSAGNYEFATVKAVSGNVVDLDNKLSRSYNPAYAVQLVRVPSYTSPVTVVGQLTAQPWNGTTGGILVFEAPGQTVTLNANIDVSTLGFRGGAVSGDGIIYCNNNYTAYFYDVSTATNGASSFKGEGIGSNNGLSLTGFELGRGAIANGGGGGNNHNSGGGGGSNSNSGGNGGATYHDPGEDYGCSTYNLGGVGGYSLDYVSSQRAFLAGGGGGGHEGDGPGYAHSATPGGNGGGLIIVKAGSIAGNGNSIISNGGSVSTVARRDGGGGGGAGGSILLDVQNYVGSLSITANGGVGGSVNGAEAQGDHGPGGGGSGGVVWTSSALPDTVSTNVAGGASGTNTRGGSPHNATAGSAGITMENLVLAEAGPCCVCCSSSTVTLSAATSEIGECCFVLHGDLTDTSCMIRKAHIFYLENNIMLDIYGSYNHIFCVENYSGAYQVYVQYLDINNNVMCSDSIIVSCSESVASSVDDASAGDIISGSSQLQVNPNPVSDVASITYRINNATVVNLELYTYLGELISVVDRGYKESGIHNFSYPTTSLTPGLYLLKLSSGDMSVTVPVTVIR